MNIPKIIIFLSIFSNLYCRAQIVCYQNTLNGGVSVIGMSTSDSYGERSFEINIPNTATVKNVFLMAYSTFSSNFEMENYQFEINGFPIELNRNNDYSVIVSNQILPSSIMGHRVYFKNLDELIPIISNSISINWTLPQNPTNTICPSCRISSPYLIILYEDENLPLTNISLLINENPNQFSGLINFMGLNPFNDSFDVGMSVQCDRVGGNLNDGYEFYVNGNSIGIVNQPDISSLVGGVIGTFEYRNGELYGLTDDVPNDSFSGADAILKLNSYISGNTLNGTQLTYNYLFPPNTPHNYFNTICLAYTSPCQPFSASLLTSDTTTCPNTPLQLGVTVPDTINATYEWLPQTNLSCYDCPNPIFTGNTTTNYTVRIWASDSCSKVLPVRVRVLPEPNFESIEITESVCGGATGTITARSVSVVEPPHVFSINGGSPQNNGNFTNLAAGAYTVTVTNAVGCSKDSVVVVGEYNNVQAAFSVNPTTGAAPLDISITNQSQNATEYFWDFSDESGTTLYQGAGSLIGVEAPLAGTYTLTLIAGNGAPHCNDTASVVILVKEPFEVFAYTFVTYEAENYQIFLSGVSEYRYKLYSLDGKLVYQKSGAVENAGNVDLWEIGSMASSMYLFRVWVKAASTCFDCAQHGQLSSQGEEEEIKGKLVVVR